MALFEPEPGGPRNLRELYHWVFGQLGRIDIGGGGGGVPVGTCLKTEIARITNSTGGEFDFSSIPAGYDRLIIEGSLRGDVAGTSEFLVGILNAVTSGYNCQVHYAANGSAANNKYATNYIGLVSGNTAPAGAYGLVRIVLENPNGGQLKSWESKIGYTRAGGQQTVGQLYTESTLTAAITRIRVRTDAFPTQNLTGTLILYGESTTV